MKVLLVHNRYLVRGGEDISRDAEEQLLRHHGHNVLTYEETNERIAEIGQFRTSIRTIWSRESHSQVWRLIEEYSPDIMHVQNFFPLISPSVYYAAHSLGLPVVQTLRNYRLFCVNGCFIRKGVPCEECLTLAFPWLGALRGCYRSSVPASTVVALMLLYHNACRTWLRRVSVFVALSEFSRRKFLAGGLPGDRIHLRPNFLPRDPGVGGTRDIAALYVGRLSEEKGIRLLMDAWAALRTTEALTVIGEGPLGATLLQGARSAGQVKLLGQKPMKEVVTHMQRARFVVVPSVCYENMPRTVIEAFACGTPVLAARIGSLAEMVQDGVQGLLFEPGNPISLTTKLRWALANGPALAEMGRCARATYETEYTAARSHDTLMDIYRKASAKRNGITW